MSTFDNILFPISLYNYANASLKACADSYTAPLIDIIQKVALRDFYQRSIISYSETTWTLIVEPNTTWYYQSRSQSRKVFLLIEFNKVSSIVHSSGSAVYDGLIETIVSEYHDCHGQKSAIQGHNEHTDHHPASMRHCYNTTFEYAFKHTLHIIHSGTVEVLCFDSEANPLPWPFK